MKKIIVSILAVTAIGLFVSIHSIFGCSVSDEEAISLAKNFCNRLDIAFEQKPWIFGTSFEKFMTGAKVKEVSFGEKGDSKIFVEISCKNKEVVGFFYWDIRQQVQKKYHISSVTTEPRHWPPFLSEDKAKEKLFFFAAQTGLPSDVVFSRCSLDKDNGIWSAYWNRMHNGFPYEDDFVVLRIMAVDGEFYQYGKNFMGEACPTEVKIDKEDAITEGWRQVGDLFKVSTWEKYKGDFEVKSAELKITQPNVLAGRMVAFYSSKSRLAWKIIYGLKSKPDRQKLAAIGFKQRVTIKIDAATKKFLGGDYTQ